MQYFIEGHVKTGYGTYYFFRFILAHCCRGRFRVIYLTDFKTWRLFREIPYGSCKDALHTYSLPPKKICNLMLARSIPNRNILIAIFHPHLHRAVLRLRLGNEHRRTKALLPYLRLSISTASPLYNYSTNRFHWKKIKIQISVSSAYIFSNLRIKPGSLKL